MQFSNRMNRFGDEVFSTLNEKKKVLEQEGKTLYNLFVGTPDFETPKEIRDALCKSGADPKKWKYTLGDKEELKQAVCDYYQRRYDVPLEKEEVASCNGSQEGMSHIGMVLCDEGDTVLLPTPCYPAFITCALMCGAKIEYYEMKEDNHFQPDVDSIPEEIADRAKFIIVSMPSNPLGSVIEEGQYEKIISWAKKHDVLVIHDNAYSDIIFDGIKGNSFLAVPGAKDIAVEFFSLSKSFDVTGARLSFLVGRKDVVQAFKKLRSQYDFGMFEPLQDAAIAALSLPFEGVKEQNQKYEERRDALCKGLRSIGWNVPDSHGTMFVWAPIPARFSSSWDFVFELMERSGVVCTPGESFGPLGKGYVRFALTLPKEEITKAIKAIDDCGILKE